MLLNNDLLYWLAANYLQITPRKFMRGLAYFAHIKTLFAATADELRVAGFTPENIDKIKNPNWTAVEKDLRWAEIPDHSIISLEHASYPYRLKQISDPPLILYVQGNCAVLQQVQLAIVGARNATPLGVKNAELFAHDLAAVGVAITSGLALGIDAAAHRATLAAKGVTIGVTGTGLEHIYPAKHTSLVAEMITKNGAVVSEFPLAMQAQAMNFPRRNRIIAGLSVGVLVVEAALKSGSLITARHAFEHGREVFAIPGSIHHLLARGCHHLIKQGAKLVETATDIIEELEVFRNLPPQPKQAVLKTLSNEVADPLLEQIGYEITPIDVVISRSQLTASEVSSILLKLELNGYVQSVPGGYIKMQDSK